MSELAPETETDRIDDSEEFILEHVVLAEEVHCLRAHYFELIAIIKRQCAKCPKRGMGECDCPVERIKASIPEEYLNHE